MIDNPDHDGTLEAMRSIRDSIRDLTQRAEQQNATFRTSSGTGFLRPIPVEFDEEIDRLQTLSDTRRAAAIAASLSQALPATSPAEPEG